MLRKGVLFIAIVGVGFSLDLPSTFKKCSRSHPNIEECVKEAIQSALPLLAKGLPEFNIDTIEPLEVPSMTIGEGKGAVHVVQKFKNIKIYGISTAIVNSVGVQIYGNYSYVIMDIDATIDEVRAEGEYDFNGRVLILPIVGKGPSKVVFNADSCVGRWPYETCFLIYYCPPEKMHSLVKLRADGFQKKNETYVKIKNLTMTLEPSSMRFNFENLFNGDERLGKEMNNLLTENWKDIWDDVKEGYEETMSLIVARVASLIFNKIPAIKLFPA